MPERFKTPKLCFWAVMRARYDKEKTAIAYVPEHLKTPEICMMAVKTVGGRAFEYIPDNLRTEEMNRTRMHTLKPPRRKRRYCGFYMLHFKDKNDNTNISTIRTEIELLKFAWLVNNGEDFKGETIMLGANIDLSGMDWEPMGYAEFDDNQLFQGTFDGNGYVISGLRVEAFGQGLGLFGHVGSHGVIKNLGIVNSSVSFEHLVGGLAGNNDGTISNCFFSGSVLGIFGVGGLAGKNSGMITDCYAIGSIEGGFSCGGLVGLSENGGAIINCYAVEKEPENKFLDVLTSYKNGDALIGYKDDGEWIGTVQNSYYNSEASEQGDTEKGEGKTAEQMRNKNTYADWDFENVWGIDSFVNDGFPYLLKFSPIAKTQVAKIESQKYTGSKITPTPTVTLNGKELIPGLDFDYEYSENISALTGGKVAIIGKTSECFGRKTINFSIIDDLEWLYRADISWYNKGTIEFIITTPEQLAGLSLLVNSGEDMEEKTIKLGNDIALNDTTGWENWNENTHGLMRWIVIGDEKRRFLGTFDGCGYVVSGIFYQCLFGYVGSSGAIKNLGIKVSCVNGGSLAESNEGAISNCYVTENISGSLARYNKGKISNCYSVGKSRDEFIDFVSHNDGAVIGCYYNKEKIEQGNTGKGEARPIARMRDKSIYIGWDFENVWEMDSSVNDGLPYLRKITPPAIPAHSNA
jgi:hypothetical protein